MQSLSNERNRISLEAAIWLLVLAESNTEETRAAFLAWLTNSRLHVEMFLYVAVAGPRSRAIPHEAGNSRPDVDRQIGSDRGAQADRAHAPISWAFASGLAVLLMAYLLVTAYFLWIRSPGLTHKTEPDVLYSTAGLFDLGNTSTMKLDTKSRASVRVSADRRGKQVRLLEGHALFEGIHDREHPLHITSGNVVVEVVGTKFDVYRDRRATTVRVQEGVVEITSNCHSPSDPDVDKNLNHNGSAAPTKLHNGQMVTAADDSCGKLDIKDLESASVHQSVTSAPEWLSFNGHTVREAVEAFNRYNARRIVVSDPILASQRLSGRFQASDVDGFLGALVQNFGARIVRGTAADGSPVVYLTVSNRK